MVHNTTAPDWEHGDGPKEASVPPDLRGAGESNPWGTAQEGGEEEDLCWRHKAKPQQHVVWVLFAACWGDLQSEIQHSKCKRHSHCLRQIKTLTKSLPVSV